MLFRLVRGGNSHAPFTLDPGRWRRALDPLGTIAVHVYPPAIRSVEEAPKIEGMDASQTSQPSVARCRLFSMDPSLQLRGGRLAWRSAHWEGTSGWGDRCCR